MAITKRTRFEVLKRDNHSCRYCGATALDVKLHVDHVIPIALGGTDKPDNLVAACKDCNTGKTSTNPNDAVVADVKASALAYATALRASIKEITGSAKGLRKIRLNLETRWVELSDEYGYRNPAPLDENWGSTLRRWLALGLDEDFLLDAMEIAFAKYGVSRADRFRYFCGVVYRTLDKAHEQVQGCNQPDGEHRYDEDGTPLPPPCGHCSSCVGGEPDDCAIYAGEYCETCDSWYCLYRTAHTEGQIHEHMRALNSGFTYQESGRCGHCEDCLSADGFEPVPNCAVYHKLPEGDDPYKCEICGRQDCMYDLGIQDGMQHEFRMLRHMVRHYRECSEVERGA